MLFVKSYLHKHFVNTFQKLSEIITTLVPIKATVKALCCQDPNLFTAKIAINFMFTKFKNADNNTRKKVCTALMTRIHECRTYMSGLLQYLHNGQSSVQVKEEIITVLSSFKC